MRGIRVESSTESASGSGSSERTHSDSGGSSSGSSSSSSRTGETSTSGRGEGVATSAGAGVNITVPSLQDEESEEIDIVTVDPVVSEETTARKGKGKQGSVMAAVRAQRQPKPIPASEANADVISALVSSGKLPQGVEVRLPRSTRRPWDCPPGFICLYESYLKACSLMLPLPKLLVEYCERRELAVSQLTASAVCNIVGLVLLAAEAGVALDVRFLEEISSVKANPNCPGTVYITFKSGRVLIEGKTSKIDRWEAKYFFVRLTPEISPDPTREMQTEWSRNLGGATRSPTPLLI